MVSVFGSNNVNDNRDGKTRHITKGAFSMEESLESLKSLLMGEHQSIAQKGVRAIDARDSQLENDSNAAKTSVRAPGLSTDEREHPFV